MKQILVISGKGGTGKTVISGAFAALAEKKILVDCDVDAANLHLLLSPGVKERHAFKCGATAFIDKEKCSGCGLCRNLCRFSAITKDLVVDPVSCEGCSFCKLVCPSGAIEMREDVSGEWFISETRFGPFVHAKLGIAKENSGKLVSLVKQKAKEIAEKEESAWMIVDGAPGIGCPVIASLSGVDCAVVVTEPTLSGLHDADRVIKVSRYFRVLVKMVINKFDLNCEMTEKIENYCKENSIEVLGKVRFDRNVVRAMVNGKTIVEYKDGIVKKEIVDIWERLRQEELR